MGRLKWLLPPDEEVGRGVDCFDVETFGADFAFTVDGGEVGELEYETFNAASAKVRVHRRNVHPGTAKGIMLNAILISMEYNDLLPFSSARYRGLRGFYHIVMEGTVEAAQLECIIRDHNDERFAQRKP